MTHSRLLPLALLALLAGCGPKHSKADIERARTALTAALDSWKNNEPPDRLKSLPEPVSFTDEMRTSYRLAEFAVGEAERTDPAVLRFPVHLQLQDRKGKGINRDVVFEVKLGSPTVIARDPFR